MVSLFVTRDSAGLPHHSHSVSFTVFQVLRVRSLWLWSGPSWNVGVPYMLLIDSPSPYAHSGHTKCMEGVPVKPSSWPGRGMQKWSPDEQWQHRYVCCPFGRPLLFMKTDWLETVCWEHRNHWAESNQSKLNKWIGLFPSSASMLNLQWSRPINTAVAEVIKCLRCVATTEVLPLHWC